MNEDAQAWSDFWAKNSNGDAAGCLPARWAAIEGAQKAAWHGFIGELADGARLLDLATGDGRVLRWMRESRSDLTLSGIDLAPELPPAPEGCETRGGVPMENVPFDADEFDAVVSQFGFEYGDTAATAKEIRRVLADGGNVGLMVHRGDGPILEHNLSRMAAIDWAMSEQNVAGVVTKAIETPGAGAAIAAQVAAVIAQLGARKFGQNSPAWEIPEALRRACLMGEQQGDASIKQTIAAVSDQAANEVGRIKSLARACAAAEARADLVGAFAATGLNLRSTASIDEPSGRALADFLIFS